MQGKGSEGGRKSMQLGEGGSVAVSDGAQAQILDVAKGANPVNDLRVYECGRTKMGKGNATCVASKRLGRVWKGLFPQLNRFGGRNWM